jgi:hypothetical protein
MLAGVATAMLLFLSMPGSARAADPPAAPQLHHAPRAVAPSAAALEIDASVDEPDKVKRAVLLYRREQRGAIVEVPFLRSSHGERPYVATVPEGDVVAPVLSYAIEVETTDGRTVPAFASRSSMHPVALTEDAADARERSLLARVDGRRTTLATSADYVLFGTTPATITPRGGAPIQTDVRDQYFRLEGQFTYRLFRTVAEFGLRAGIVRGSSPVPDAKKPSDFDVGLNYGAPRLRLRATDWLHVDGEFLTSVTEVGYSVGGGGAAILGDPLGTRLTLGFEGIEVFGMRGYTRFDVAVTRRILAGTLIEVTNMPHAETAGVRLAADVRFDLGAGFGVGVRGGYQARTFASGGPSAGLAASYAF